MTTSPRSPRAPCAARRRWSRPGAALPLLLMLLASVASSCRPAVSAYTPRDPVLRKLPLYFYPSTDSGRAPRALLFFFGNDVGFWQAHQELATRLADDDFAVVGFDVKRFLATLPDAPAARDSAYAADIDPIVDRARHELGADRLPLVLGGHSIGAEIALWTAAHAAPRGTIGVLAMSPGLRGHLRVTLSDLANASEPHERGSFDVPSQVAATPPAFRVAVVRGDGDKYAYADSALLAAAPGRVRRFVVPFAGHSLKGLTLTAPVIARAMEFVVSGNR